MISSGLKKLLLLAMLLLPSTQALFVGAGTTTSLFDRHLQGTSGLAIFFGDNDEDDTPDDDNKGPPDTFEPQVCDTFLPSVEGYCEDANGDKYDYCYSHEFSNIGCQLATENTFGTVGWSYYYNANKGEDYCEMYFESVVTGNSIELYCPPDFLPSGIVPRNTGTGWPQGADGNPGIYCHTCEPSDR